MPTVAVTVHRDTTMRAADLAAVATFNVTSGHGRCKQLVDDRVLHRNAVVQLLQGILSRCEGR
jgi:hypothetical protein